MTSPAPPPEAAAPPRGARARRHDLTRDDILQHATELLLEFGVDGLTMRRLAKRAGFTVGALYRYVTSADALVAEVALQVLEGLAVRLAAAREASTSPLQALTSMIDTYRDFAQQDPHGFGLVSLLVADRRFLVTDTREVAAVSLQVARTLAPVCGALEEAVASGALLHDPDNRSAQDRALALFAGLQGALLLDKLGRRAPELLHADATARLVASAMLMGWGAAPERIALRPPAPAPSAHPAPSA